MKIFARIAALICLFVMAVSSQAAPLRVYIRAGVKTHGPGQHDHPRFLEDWTKLLRDRGVTADGGMNFPSADQLKNTDVVVVYAADGMKIVGQDRANFEDYLKRGGGLVVIHDGVVAGEENEWAKKVQGGSWRWDGDKKTKWLEAEVGIYFVNPEHPIVKGVSNFDWKDEIYYDMDMAPDVHVLATSFQSVFIIAPQMWTYEKTWDGGTTPYRAFVSIPGHEYTSFQEPQYKAILLRGIAWAGKRDNVDEFCRKEELDSLTYPQGGPTRPELAASKINVHPDFNISLVASEPLIEKVISLDWAPDGKLWVAETPEYPGGRTINKNDKPIARWAIDHPDAAPGEQVDRKPRDRVSWLEDTDGDGRMDQKHVFYDGLELVTSLVFYKDGVIVSQAPDILWLRDTNGDGKADKVEKLYTGFGNFDTHAVLNNMRWGMDGWIYSAIGYSAGNPTSGDGSKSFGRVTAGIIRFKPDGSAVEQYASGSCNTWGFDFAPDGELFYTTATCGEHFLHIVMPEKVLARGSVGGIRSSWVVPDHQKIFPAVHHTRPAYVQIDWVGMFTAAAGCCIYNGGAWPDKWTGNHFCSETTMSLVHHEVLQPKGVTYTASREAGREETEFIAGTDLWFRPIHERIGPDGALYVVDFYNQAAIHNDTRGPAHGAHNAATRPDRDHHFGRIWRVQHKQARKLDVPKLNTMSSAQLVASLSNPNGWTRDTAARLLREKGAGNDLESLKDLARDASKGSYGEIAALYTLSSLGELDGDLLLAAIGDKDPIVRKNALRIGSERDNSGYSPDPAGLKALLNDPEPRVRLNGLIALGTCDLTPELAKVVVEAWRGLDDKYLQSAAIGVAAKDPVMFIETAFGASDPAFLADFVGYVTRALANRQDASLVAALVKVVARQPASTDGLKQSVLETLATTLRADTTPEWNSDLASAMKLILGSSRPGLPGAALPLIARWDKSGSLGAELKPVISELSQKLQDSGMTDEQRGQIAVNLLGVRNMDANIIPNVAKLLNGAGSAALMKRVIEALGSTGDPAAASALIAAFPKFDTEQRESAFGQLIRRADWAGALVQAIADKKVELSALGPANLYRLRTHADKAVAARAGEVIDAIKGPEQKQKDALIAKFKPEVEKPGDVENGKKIFLANCAACHRFKNDGADFAPNLTGMGAHGPAELLVHIVDPNRLVEPNFVATSIETKDDESLDGIILRENQVSVVLRNQTSEYEIRKDNIKSRRSTGRSLMPEGFEALGGDGLRDLLAYICADENRYRILDLGPVFSANTSRGVFASAESREETLRFRKFGTIKAGDVPFDIINPQKTLTGNNVIILKGTSGMARNYPEKVEIKVGLAVSQLHFLGGVGGWAWPYDGERNKNLPVTKVTAHFAGGATEEIVLKNGVEFADYIARNDVPGSAEVPDLLQNGRQVRWFSKPIKNSAVLETLTLESYNNIVAPVFVGITAELAGAGPKQASATPAPAAKQDDAADGSAKVLITGGNTSHDFARWWGQEDVSIINGIDGFKASYTENLEDLVEGLKSASVLYLAHNKATSDSVRSAILEFVNSGKGLIVGHAAGWYNQPAWPDYNRLMVGGGTRGHDRLGEFEVTVVDSSHPVMAGVPATFKITDELYNFQKDPDGSAIIPLATAKSPLTGKVFPVVWVVQNFKPRIVCITLGHDGRAHELEAYRTILKNAVKWTSKK